jgi:formate dehydrogenase subunit delta
VKPEVLVRMANQIADFFRTVPEPEAVAGTADHIQKFWDPRMRAQLKTILNAGGEGLNPIARTAAEKVV